MVQGYDPDDVALDLENEDKRTELNPPITGKDVSEGFIMSRVLNQVKKFLLDLIK